MRLGDLDALKKAYFNAIDETSIGEVSIINLIDNAPTVEPRIEYGTDGQPYRLFMSSAERSQGECKDCNNCEDKALSYSMGFQDGYLLGGFQLTELRRWLIAQGYSEGTVDDKIEDFNSFVKRVREDEG